jgi:hypothetical protein
MKCSQKRYNNINYNGMTMDISRRYMTLLQFAKNIKPSFFFNRLDWNNYNNTKDQNDPSSEFAYLMTLSWFISPLRKQNNTHTHTKKKPNAP